MDVKNAFLNEEVYASQPPSFEDNFYPHHVFKFKKTMYGLQQTPRQWNERLTNVLQSKGYARGVFDKNTFH